MEDQGPLFVEEPRDAAETPARRSWGRTVALCSVVVVVAVVGVVVGLVVTSSSPHGSSATTHRIMAALSATVSSGSYDVAYQLSSSPPTNAGGSAGASTGSCAPPPASSPPIIGGLNPSPADSTGAATSCVSPGDSPTGSPNGPTVSGTGTIDTNPFAMVVTAAIDGNQLGGGDVTLRVDSTNVFPDIGSLDGGLTPPAQLTGLSGEPITGEPIASFLSVNEATLGPLEGAWATLDISNPDGYLDLAQDAITSASVTGNGTVGGTAVTDYRVTLDASSQAEQVNLSPGESQAIDAADGVLRSYGLRGTTVDLAIDAAGFVRHLVAVSSFADGATVTTSVTFSNFGCAGTVLMPGQTSGAPAGRCAETSTATSTTTTGATSTTSSTTTSTTSTGTPTTVSASPTTSAPTTTPVNSGPVPPSSSTTTTSS